MSLEAEDWREADSPRHDSNRPYSSRFSAAGYHQETLACRMSHERCKLPAPLPGKCGMPVIRKSFLRAIGDQVLNMKELMN
jgi:hypothetical protein